MGAIEWGLLSLSLFSCVLSFWWSWLGSFLPLFLGTRREGGVGFCFVFVVGVFVYLLVEGILPFRYSYRFFLVLLVTFGVPFSLYIRSFFCYIYIYIYIYSIKKNIFSYNFFVYYFIIHVKQCYPTFVSLKWL